MKSVGHHRNTAHSLQDRSQAVSSSLGVDSELYEMLVVRSRSSERPIGNGLGHWLAVKRFVEARAR